MSVSDVVTVVICDDEEHMRSLHERVAGFAAVDAKVPIDVNSFTDGTGALEFIRQRGNVDRLVLITDGDMSPMSGWELCARLLREDLLPACSIACSDISQNGFEMLAPKKAQETMFFVPKKVLAAMQGNLTVLLPMVLNGEPLPEPPHRANRDEETLDDDGFSPPEPF